MNNVNTAELAKLARLEVSAEDLGRLEGEIRDILAFVEKIKEVEIPIVSSAPEPFHVMRADGKPHESGAFTQKLLDAAPASEGGRVAVKQVIRRTGESRRSNKP